MKINLPTFGLLMVFAVSSPAPETPRLPGARPDINAIDYDSLQAAFDAIPESGGLVRLPAGTFEIKEPLFIRAGDVCVEGAGTATHIKNVGTNGEAAIVLELPAAKQGGAERLWRIRLANFRVTGNEKSGHGIIARRINEVFIDGMTVSYHGGDGILLDNCYEDPRVCDSLITYNKGTGLNLDGCHDIVVSANQFEENNDGVRCTDGYNICMTGNCLDDHLGNGVVIENTYGSVLSGNMIEECVGTAVILDRDCYGIALSANVIAHNGAGIDLRDAHGCAVSANAFTIMKTDALRIGKDSGRIAVGGNSFGDSYIGEDAVKRGTNDLAAAGLTLDGASEVGIAGNVFSGVWPKAITMSGSERRILVGGNVFTATESDHSKVKGVVGDGNLEVP